MHLRLAAVTCAALTALAPQANAAPAPSTTAAPAPSTTAAPAARPAPGYTFAVVGDLPYGAAQVAALPAWIAQINADPDVRSVVHLGDIKNGSSVCSDAYFAQIRAAFDTFADPLVYTVGDNEWTDCHRPNNGAYDPLERLDKVRQVFFDRPGRTLGRHPMRVRSTADLGIPEQVRWRERDVTFTAVDVVGSNNGLQPWTGEDAPTARQRASVAWRTAVAMAWVHQAFADATRRGDRAVVINQQADMFDPGYTPTPDDISVFVPYVRLLAAEAARFRGQVYLFNGDSHAYNADNPLGPGSPWLATYGVEQPVGNLRRVTVDGSSNNKDWLKVTINPKGAADVLRWQRVPYTVQAG